MTSTIRFLKVNRYRKPVGAIDTLMGFGVHSALVHRGIAEFVTTPAPELVASGISEPVATSTDNTKRRRRSDSIEE